MKIKLFGLLCMLVLLGGCGYIDTSINAVCKQKGYYGAVNLGCTDRIGRYCKKWEYKCVHFTGQVMYLKN